MRENQELPTPVGPLSPSETIRRRLDPRLLRRGRVVIIGLGGIGLCLTRALATFLAGLRGSLRDDEDIHILLCDGDRFEVNNGYRMDVPDYGNKAVALGRELLEKMNCQGITVRWLAEHVGEQNVKDVIQEGDLVLLACDNHATRRLVGRHCSNGALENVALISGGNDGVEQGFRGSYGNVQVYLREQGRDLTAPLDRFHPEIASPADRLPDAHDCLLAAAAGAPQISLVNLAVASAMCSALLRLIMPVGGERPYDEVSLDVLDAVCAPHWISGPRHDSPPPG